MEKTFLTTEELSQRIKYDTRTIRERLKDSVLLEGVHYIRPFGGRKILFIWEQIESDMAKVSSSNSMLVPMANGGVLFLRHNLLRAGQFFFHLSQFGLRLLNRLTELRGFHLRHVVNTDLKLTQVFREHRFKTDTPPTL